MAMSHLFGVSLFPEVEVRRNGVLEEMYDKKPNENIYQCAFACQMDGFRNHFHNCNREHVACAERKKILQVTARPLAVDHEIPAKQVCRPRLPGPEQGGKCDTEGKVRGSSGVVSC